MLTFAQFGAGRIGRIHAANIAAHPAARLKYVVDVNAEAALALAGQHGAAVTDVARALADPEVTAVVVASSTDTHADLIEASARAGKAIFCEKPIDLDSARVGDCLAVVAETGTPLMLGFNRRFDPTFAALRKRLLAGEVGDVEQVVITSRDPGPPPVDYIKVSGGLFRDMMIHDLDIARWLLGEAPTRVFATGACLVDPAIGAAGDIDTATVVLTTKRGTQAVITNSRRAAYGYDQRVEVLGSRGMLQAGNRTETAVLAATADAVSTDKPMHFFLERYAEAYRLELDAFIRAVAEGRAPDPGGEDGRMALKLADAALESLKSGAPVNL